METKEVKHLLQRFFDGDSTVSEERKLEAYFRSGEVAEELEEYTGFFGGISELANTAADENSIDDRIMDYILENESQEKSKYRWMWKTVTGIAASIIIVVGGILLYQQQDETYEDTFESPEVAYAYAEQTLEYVSSKYNKGLAELSNFDKLQTASQPLREGVKPINAFYEYVEQMSREKSQKE